jgi:hypothetical protein
MIFRIFCIAIPPWKAAALRQPRIRARTIPGLNRLFAGLGEAPVHFQADDCIFAATSNRLRGFMRGVRSARFVSGLLLAIAAPVAAQQPTTAAPTVPMPAVGDMAPDFAITGATRYGLLKQPLRLSDFKGQTVVLAFFVRARTRG